MTRCPLATLALLTVAAVSSPAAGAKPATSEFSKQAGVVASEFVFDRVAGRQCHASTIAETKAGLVAAWFAGTREGKDDVGIWVSRHVEGVWTPPAQVFDGSEGEDRVYPCWNPVLFQRPKGPLALYYKVGPNPRTWWGMVATSADSGASWSRPRRLGSSEAVGHLIGPVKNKPIALDDGILLSPSSTEHAGWRLHFERSSDGGKTWSVVGPVHDASRLNAIQPSLLRHGDGKLQVLCRTREGVVGTSWSTDRGLTWSKPEKTQLPNPNSGTDATTLADGRHLLVYNHTKRGGPFPSGRNMLNLAVSRDGKQWDAALVLERSEGEFSYPSVLETADGLVHVTYTWRRERVKHVVVDPDELEAQPIVEGRWPNAIR